MLRGTSATFRPTARSLFIIYALSNRWPTVFQLTTFQMAEKYSALRFSYCR